MNVTNLLIIREIFTLFLVIPKKAFAIAHGFHD